MNMEAQKRVIPNCVYASNPFHECTRSCLKKIVEAKPQMKNSGPISIVSLLRRKKKKESQSESFEPSDSESASKSVHPFDLSSPKSLHSSKGNVEPLIDGNHHHPEQDLKEIMKEGSSSVCEVAEAHRPKDATKDDALTSVTPQHLSPVAATGSDVLASAGAYFDFAFTGSIIDSSSNSFDSAEEIVEPMSNVDNYEVDSYPPPSQPASYSFRDSILVSSNPSMSKKKVDQWHDASEHHIRNDAPQNSSISSAGADLDLRFQGIVHSYDRSDWEATSISSESRVSVGKYRVEESLATTLRSIIAKHGDIAANCRLESLAMRSYYLECVCFVAQTLKSTPIPSFTESKVKELSQILQDAESARINVAWLRGILNEIAQDVNLISELTALELAKSTCDHDLESAMKELESKLEFLSQKEKEIAVMKARISETRRFIVHLELKSSELNKRMLSLMSKVDNMDGISLRRVMKMI